MNLLGCCIPYHVQLFHKLLAEDAAQRRSAQVSPADVQRVHTTRMLSSHGHVELAHMEERLRLFGILEHDGYLRRDPDGMHRFESKLLREWWRARFGAFYTAAGGRP